MKQHMHNVQLSWSPGQLLSFLQFTVPCYDPPIIIEKMPQKLWMSELLHHFQMKSIYWDNNFEKSLLKPEEELNTVVYINSDDILMA